MKWILGILLIFLVACSSAPESEPSAEQTTTESVPAEAAPSEGMSKVKAMGIAAALELGQPVKCTSTQNGETATIYMKGSQMRMDTSPSDAHAIYTADTMYSWQGNQGVVMKLSEIKKFAESAGQAYQPKTQDEVVANAEQYNAQCEVTSVSESMFSPPSDVQFQDLGDMMKQLEAYTGSIPQQ